VSFEGGGTQPVILGAPHEDAMILASREHVRPAGCDAVHVT